MVLVFLRLELKIQDDRQCSGDRCFGWVTDAFAKECDGEKKGATSDTAIRDKTAVLYKQGRGRNRW